MPRHSFVRHIKLGDVKGRIDYIQNPKRQEHLYAAYDTAPETFWPLLAKQNRLITDGVERGETVSKQET